MYTTITNSYFHQAFINMGRGDNFSYVGRNMLFDYLEQLEEDTGEQIKLDVIALCCEYVETTYDDVILSYDLEQDVHDLNDYERKEYVLDYLNNHSMIVGHNDDRVVYQAF